MITIGNSSPSPGESSSAAPHRGLIDLPFTLATADRFKLLDVTHEVANQVRSRTLETRREREQTLDVRETLRAVEIRGDTVRYSDS
jgi:hypothetical protein